MAASSTTTPSDDVRVTGEGPGMHPDELPPEVERVAQHADQTEPQEKQDALDWFLAEDSGDAVEPTYTIQINVSTDIDHPQWIDWQIKPIPSQRIDYLRRTFSMQPNREQRRRGQTADLDAARFNAALVFEATVYPDLEQPLRTKGFRDGAELITWRFRGKPLLVDQIAGEILQRSGGDEADLRTATEVRAGKA